MSGAQSSRGTTEAETNLKIALKLQNLLEQSGCTVILTRSDENAIYDLDKTTLREKKISDIRNRVKIGNSSSADLFVSVHLNKIPQQQYWGWQCFYNSKNERSINLAKKIQSNLNIINGQNAGSIKKALEEATKLVESAEKSLNNDDYEVALKAVNSLVDSDAKTALVERLDKVKFNIEVNKAAIEKCSSSEPNQGTCSNANYNKWILLSVILFVGLLTESAYLIFKKK